MEKQQKSNFIALVSTAEVKGISFDAMCAECGVERAKPMHRCPIDNHFNNNKGKKCNCCDKCTADCNTEIS